MIARVTVRRDLRGGQPLWAGTVADSPTGLPYLAEAEGMPNCFLLLGCGGNGITFSAIAAS